MTFCLRCKMVLWTFFTSVVFSFLICVHEVAENTKSFLKRGVRFCDQLPSNTVVLNHLNAEYIEWSPWHIKNQLMSCSWADSVSGLTGSSSSPPIKLHQSASDSCCCCRITAAKTYDDCSKGIIWRVLFQNVSVTVSDELIKNKNGYY